MLKIINRKGHLVFKEYNFCVKCVDKKHSIYEGYLEDIDGYILVSTRYVHPGPIDPLAHLIRMMSNNGYTMYNIKIYQDDMEVYP